MADIEIVCLHCGETAQAPAELAGQVAECPNCGEDITIPAPAKRPKKTIYKSLPKTPNSSASRHSSAQQKVKGEVVVTDVSMPFGSMVIFMIKWSLAAIPAFIILSIFWFIIVAIMGGCAAASLSGM